MTGPDLERLAPLKTFVVFFVKYPVGGVEDMRMRKAFGRLGK